MNGSDRDTEQFPKLFSVGPGELWFSPLPPSNTDQGGGGFETKCFSCSEGKREEIERHARECAMLVSEQERRQKHLWRFSF